MVWEHIIVACHNTKKEKIRKTENETEKKRKSKNRKTNKYHYQQQLKTNKCKQSSNMRQTETPLIIQTKTG